MKPKRSQLGPGQNPSSWAKETVSRPKRNWRSALHDASRLPSASEVPAGLGVRARQRRFPTGPRPFIEQPLSHPHAPPSRGNTARRILSCTRRRTFAHFAAGGCNREEQDSNDGASIAIRASRLRTASRKVGCPGLQAWTSSNVRRRMAEDAV